jgi:hypothetical protein
MSEMLDATGLLTGLLDYEVLNSLFCFWLNMRPIVGIGLNIHKAIDIKDFNEGWLVVCGLIDNCVWLKVGSDRSGRCALGLSFANHFRFWLFGIPCHHYSIGC